MNLIEKRKAQLRALGIVLLALSFCLFAGGLIMTIFGAINTQIVLLIFGIIFLLASIAGVVVGIVFTWTSSAIKATEGNIAEEILGQGTVNLNKCTNCGAKVEEGETLCEECKENLKP